MLLPYLKTVFIAEVRQPNSLERKEVFHGKTQATEHRSLAFLLRAASVADCTMWSMWEGERLKWIELEINYVYLNPFLKLATALTWALR